MQRNLTWSLFAGAVCLFALIYFFERKLPSSAERHQAKPVLPITSAADIQSIEVTLSPGALVRAEKTNGVWMLTEPRYPAKQVALDTFATNLVGLRAFDRVPPHEVKLQGEKSFGLAPPRAIVAVNSGTNTFELEIGGIAPITSNLYIRLPQSGEVVLAGTGLLETLPRGTNDWRTPALFQLSARDFDHIEVKAGQRSFELGRGTNNAWQISKPVPARADQDRVLELLQGLRSVEVLGFVADSPGADLERFGLQSPEVEVSFSADTNRLYAIDFGQSPTNQTNVVFAMLIAPGQTNVVLASRALAEYLKQPYTAYHDPRLVTIAAGALDRIVVHGREDFTLQRQPNGAWIIDDQTKTPLDPVLFSKFVTAAGSLRIVDIVKEVPTETDLKTFGFLPPVASYSFFQKLTNNTGVTTNILFTDLTFGHPRTDTIYVRRSDENPIYLTQLAYLVDLPKRAFELRDRKLWRFDTNALLQISISSGTNTNSVSRTAAGWSTSNDPIFNAQMEEIAFRLSRLEAQEWVDKGSKRLATFGINESSPTLTLELRDAKEDENYSLRFGRQTLRHDVYAAIRFAGDREPTIFEFPGDTYQLMLQSLPFPK
jgi:hypothetical protein